MRFVVRFRKPVLFALLAMTALLCSRIGSIRLPPDPLASLYPAGHRFLPALEAIQRMAPETRMLIAVLEVKKGDIYTQRTVRKIDRVTKALMDIEGVLPGGIVSLTRGMEHYENTAEGLDMGSILGDAWPETEADFEKLERRIAVNPRGLGRYVSYDGTAAMMTAALKGGNGGTLMENLLDGVEAVRSREEDAHHNLYFMGPQLIEAQMTDMGSRHVPLAAAGTLLVILVGLSARFRTLRGVLLPLLVMFFSLLWTFGMLGASGRAFHPMPLSFPVILGLFSLVYGIAVLEQYDRAYPETRDPARALRSAYESAPIAGSILTAGLVLVSLFGIGIPAFRSLAWFGLFWSISTAVAVGLLLPVLVSFVRAPGAIGSGPQAVDPIGAHSSCEGSSRKARLPVLGLVSALLVAGALSAGRLQVGDNIPGSSYIRPNHPWNRCFRLLADKFMGPYQFLIHTRASETGGLLDPEALNAVGDFSRYLAKQTGARDSIAFDMMVKAARHMLMDGNPKWRTIPLSREQIKGMAELVVDQGGVEEFVDRTFTEATISPFYPEAGTERIEEYAASIEDYISRHPSDRLDFHPGGGLLGMTKAINDGTGLAYGRTLTFAFALVLLGGVFATGTLRGGLVSLLPVALAQGMVWIIMAGVGMKLSMAFALTSAAAVGLSAHFGYSMTREKDPSPAGADPHLKGALIFRGAIVTAGLLPWCLIGLKFPSRMALAASMTVFFAALGSVLLESAFTVRSRQGSRPSVRGEAAR